MHYKLTISERAESHIDNILDYVVNVLKNPGAARAIIVDIEEAYSRLEYMAESFRYCNDSYLAGRDIARSCFRVTIILFCTA